MNYDYKARRSVEQHIIACGLSYINDEKIHDVFKNELKEDYFKDSFSKDVCRILINAYKADIKPTLEYVANNRGAMYKESFGESNELESYQSYLLDLVNIVSLATTKERFETDLLMLKEFLIMDYWNTRSDEILTSYWQNRDVFIVSENLINGYHNLLEELTYNYSVEDEEQTIESIKERALKKLNERLAGIDNTVKIGHTYLDNHTGGFGGSEFIIIGGRPSMGKTAFALSMAKKLSLDKNDKGLKGAYFTLEMSKEQLINKYAANQFKIPYADLKEYRITKEQMNILFQYYDWIDKSNLDIMFTSDIDKIQTIVENGDYDYAIIDYLQLCTTKGNFQSREQQVSYISRTLKSISRRKNIPVIALSQLKRVSGRPSLMDLRESGSLEQDADTVIFPYRPAYDMDNPQPFEQGNIEFILAKCRSSGMGTFYGHMDLTSYDILDFQIINQSQWDDYLNSKKYN